MVQEEIKYITKDREAGYRDKSGGHEMLLKMDELSQGMGKVFIRDFMDTARHISCTEGQLLFKAGEATHYFYTLIHGELRLIMGAYKQHVYTVCLPGEIFGWSSLVSGGTYSATAVCTQFSEILRFDRDLLDNLLNRFPVNGMFFYKTLAKMLGNRLLESYRIIQEKENLTIVSMK